MPGYQEILTSLRGTQELFKFETREYKDFRDALSALSKAMIACGNRNLTANEVLNLRTLTAKAREAWASYMGQIQERIRRGIQNQVGQGNQIEQNLENPNVPDVANPLSGTDRRRMQILNGMTEMLDGDLAALRNYNISRNLTLEQIILENRGLTADVRGKYVPTVGAASNSRMVLEVNGVKGAFTEDFAGVAPAQVREEYSRKYPALAPVLQLMAQLMNNYSTTMAKSAEELAEKMLNKSDPVVNMVGTELVGSLQNYGVMFPQQYARQDGKTWFDNPEFVRQFADTMYHICLAEDSMTTPTVAKIGPGLNIPKRNAAMSVIADRIGMPDLIARSKVMKVRTDKGEKTGVFMEWARGEDIRANEGKLNKNLMGKPRNYNSARLIKSAADLQVLDYLCGNVDRHNGNMVYQFEEINGVMTLVGVQGIDNDASFGKVKGDKKESKLASLDSMRVMTRSSAEAVLRLTKEELKYSLYGLVNEEEMEYAWERTERLQNKIRESMKIKWKSETSLRPDAIRILDDNSPVWGKLELLELKANMRNGEDGGVFTSLASIAGSLDYQERQFGFQYQDHTRSGVRKNYYKPTQESTVYGDLKLFNFPRTNDNLTAEDVFRLYRNRRSLHGDPAAIAKGKQAFDQMFDSIVPNDGQIQRDIGWTDRSHSVYIDGMPAKEYVRKYSPENVENTDYVKAQIMAAITSGRHHVDMVMVRTQSDGTFKVAATEVTMNLSAMNGNQHFGEYSRETRRKSLIKNEDTRLERQRTIEQTVLQKVNRTADRKVEKLMPQDPVRSEVFRTIPYRDIYGKNPKDIEKQLDQEIDRREKERLRLAVRAKENEIEKKQFDDMKKNIEGNREAAPAPVQARDDGDRIRERISLAALDLAAPKKGPAANRPLQANQPRNPQLQNQAGNRQQQNQPQNQQQNQPQNQGGQQQNQPGRPGRGRRGSI